MSDEKMPTLEEAEDALAKLEKPGHDLDLATMALRAAEQTGDSKKISEALSVYRAALSAKDAAGIKSADIDAAAQLVLEIRGEAHTETNVLPSDHGLATVLAGRALALAQGELVLSPSNKAVQAKVKEAQRDFDEAQAADTAAKAAHAAEGARRALAAMATASSEGAK